MLRIFVFTVLFILTSLISGQISHGGRPLMMDAGKTLKGVGTSVFRDRESVVSFQPPSREYVQNELMNNRKGRPLRFAYPNFVELTPDNSGITTVLDDGRLYWQLRIKSSGAYSLNVVFDRFQLQPGDSLFIYNPSGSYVLGALTTENNKNWGGLATAPVPGDEIIIEWRGNKIGEDATKLKIGAVNHDFLNVFDVFSSKTGNFGDSGSCHTDLTCFDNDTFLQNGRSACEVIVNGTEYCSGTLLNNTNNDGTPYVLTAGHCLGSEISPESVVVIFNYEVPQCQTFIDGSKIQSISGSDLRAFADQLDFALLEMSEYPPDYFRTYYSGWDLTTLPSGVVHSVHHPYGDVKKVAVSSGVPVVASYSATSRFGNTFLNDSHWKVAEWADGTTEPGSSGAGLFLDNGAFIGSLSGGAATCSNPVNDYFIRLNKIWDHLPEDTARVDVWLNPSGEALTSLPGYDPVGTGMLRVSHFPDNGTPQVQEITGEGGLWTGPNSLNITDVAEKFDEFISGQIYGVFLVPGKNYVADDGEVDIKIWSGLNKPELLLGGKNNVKINGEADKEILVLFDQPVSFSGPFFVGYSNDYIAPVDSFAVYQAYLSKTSNSLYLKSPDLGWQPYPDLSGDLPSMVWIDALVGNAVFTDSSDVLVPEHFTIAPNPAASYTYIYYTEDGTGEISVFDLNGKLVLTQNIVIYQNRYQFIFSKRLKSGVYFLQLRVNGKTSVSKLIVR
ncbi:T9SS type A sorting domain-containing protein [Anaerophaga thermohalophila]|uniref:T9SS type A sorting domain-containing protein n=1 Tax=Anaerophaga thermohalophila TaxID=177400 RepID=UPI000237C464|nr:T9SS type A sorting domain-containing protein [Anaerophaga thermohalophila]